MIHSCASHWTRCGVTGDVAAGASTMEAVGVLERAIAAADSAGTPHPGTSPCCAYCRVRPSQYQALPLCASIVPGASHFFISTFVYAPTLHCAPQRRGYHTTPYVVPPLCRAAAFVHPYDGDVSAPRASAAGCRPATGACAGQRAPVPHAHPHRHPMRPLQGRCCGYVAVRIRR